MPLQVIFFKNVLEFKAWLERHSESAKELLVGYYKVASSKPTMTWSESVDEALCVGWIDGVRRTIDIESYSIRFTPRRKDSIWSAVNVAKVEKLIIEGRMKPSGLKAYSHLKKSSVYSHEQKADSQLTEEELKLFKKNVAAWQYFEKTPPSYKKIVFHWINSAKKEDTRLKRLEKLITLSADGKRSGW